MDPQAAPAVVGVRPLLPRASFAQTVAPAITLDRSPWYIHTMYVLVVVHSIHSTEHVPTYCTSMVSRRNFAPFGILPSPRLASNPPYGVTTGQTAVNILVLVI